MLIQEGNKRFARLQGRNRFLRIKGRIRPECLRRHLDRLLVQRRIGPERVLNPVPQLSENRHGNVRRALGNEIDAHALGTDQPYYLLNLLHEGPAAVVEQQMGFVKEENNHGLVRVSPFRKPVIQRRKHPQQERGIHRRIVEKPVGGKDIDDALFRSVLVFRYPKPAADIQRRFPEEGVSALVFQNRHRALDRADAG